LKSIQKEKRKMLNFSMSFLVFIKFGKHMQNIEKVMVFCATWHPWELKRVNEKKGEQRDYTVSRLP